MSNRFASSHAVGICGTVLLHALFLQAVTLGASAPKRRVPDETGPGATSIVSGADLSMTLVLVQLPGVTPSDALEELASRGFAAANVAIQVVSPDPAPAIDAPEDPGDEDAEAARSVGDPATRSLLFGRYTGQINARIERAWLKPRSAVTDQTAVPPPASNDAETEQDDLFRCAVRITQDTRGNVKEIELARCNGTLVWQQSLVNAIQQASPLPAPPSPTVFTNALTLTFEGRAYTPGLREDEYESATYRLVRADTAVPGRYQSSPPAPTASVEATEAQADPGLPFDAPVQPPNDSEFDRSPR